MFHGLFQGGRSWGQLQECVHQHNERFEVKQAVNNGRIRSVRLRSPAQLENCESLVVNCHISK